MKGLQARWVEWKGSFFWPLILGLLLVRVLVPLARHEMIWPDEHFQTLEPAYGLVHGTWFKAWEWDQGFRSWIPPLLFVPLFGVLKFLGFSGGMPLISSARLLCSLLSLLIPFGLDRFARDAGWSLLARAGMLLVFLASSSMAIWGAATLTDSMGTSVLWGVFPLAFQALRDEKPFKAGALAALPFLIRPHLGIFSLVFGGAVLSIRRYRPVTLWVLGGGLCIGAVSGIVDFISWGLPFHSLGQQLGAGIEKSKFYGVEPWYTYFGRLFSDQGRTWIAMSLLLGISGFIRTWVRGQSKGVLNSPLFWISVGCVLFFGVHMALPHKETRFIQPVMPWFFLAFGYGLHAWAEGLESVSWQRGFKAFVVVAGLSGLLGAVSRPLYLSSTDIAPLFDRIYREEKRDPSLERGCVLLVDHNWSWTRGALGLGRAYAGEDRKLSEVSPADLHRCSWVILKDDRIAQLRQLPGGADVSSVMKQSNGYELLRTGL